MPNHQHIAVLDDLSLWLAALNAPFPQDYGTGKLRPYHLAYGECLTDLGLSALPIVFTKNEEGAILRGRLGIVLLFFSVGEQDGDHCVKTCAR